MNARALSANVKFYASLARPALVRAYLTMPRRHPPAGHDPLASAIEWICCAQDATGDGGVARSYSIAYSPGYARRGWIPSYPETTGYIIPTMFDYARRSGRQDLFARATRMAEWESTIQLPTGAVMGGTVDAARPTPAVFNTGQVLFGWIRAFEETRQARFLESARRAGDFLVAAQDPDGAWRKHLTDFASGAMASYTYNTRSAWGLLALGDAAGHLPYRAAAIRNVEYALTQQLPNGWLQNNCLSDASRPLVHTIAYALRGILEVGLATGECRFVEAAQRGADALLRQQRSDGSLAGRYTRDWEPAAAYSCVTGNAQMGLVWGRLYQATGDARYLDGLVQANRFVESVQWAGTGDPGLDGGISGSHPLHGQYGRFEVLNWAVKFFADALMLERSLGGRGTSTSGD